MYMGDPHSVAAIMLLWRYRAKPKSAVERRHEAHVLLSPVTQTTIVGTEESMETPCTPNRARTVVYNNTTLLLIIIIIMAALLL